MCSTDFGAVSGNRAMVMVPFAVSMISWGCGTLFAFGAEAAAGFFAGVCGAVGIAADASSSTGSIIFRRVGIMTPCSLLRRTPGARDADFGAQVAQEAAAAHRIDRPAHLLPPGHQEQVHGGPEFLRHDLVQRRLRLL